MRDLLDDSLAGYICEKRKMFGCPAYFINNNMFAGMHGDFIILRLSEADRDEVKAKYDEVGQFEPFEDRPMKE